MAMEGFHCPVSYWPRSLLFMNAFFFLYSNIVWFFTLRRVQAGVSGTLYVSTILSLGFIFLLFSVISRLCSFMTAFNTHTKRKAWRAARIDKRDGHCRGKPPMVLCEVDKRVSKRETRLQHSTRGWDGARLGQDIYLFSLLICFVFDFISRGRGEGVLY